MKSSTNEKKRNNPDIESKMGGACFQDLTKLLKKEKKTFTEYDYFIQVYHSFCISINSDKKVVIIQGGSGCGKTSIVEFYVEQVLERGQNIKLIEITNYGASKLKLDEANFEKMAANFKLSKKSKNIVLISIPNHALEETLKKIVVLSEYIEKVLKFEDLKFVIEVIEDEKKLEFKTDKTIRYCFDLVCFGPNATPEEIVDILKPRIEELSMQFPNIKFTKKILIFLVCLNWDKLSPRCNFKEILILFSKAFFVASELNLEEIDITVAQVLFSSGFGKVKLTSKKNLKRLAYHEVGHTLLRTINYGDVAFVTLIPGSGFGGATFYNPTFNDAPITRETKVREISVSLAGRLSEKVFLNIDYNAGAHSDLEKTKSVLRDTVFSMGADKNIGTNLLIKDKEKISEKMLETIEKNESKLLKEAEIYTIATLKKHKKFVKKLVKKLLKDKVVFGSEIMKMWKKYLKERKHK